MLKDLFHRQSLKEFLLERGTLNEKHWEKVEIESQNATSNLSEFALVSKLYGTDMNVMSALSEYSKTELVALREITKISPDIIQLMPRQIIIASKFFPFSFGDTRNEVKIAFVDPSQELIENIEMRTDKKVIPFLTNWDDCEAMYSKHYGDANAIEAASQYEQERREAEAAAAAANLDADAAPGSSPIITVVNSIIENAARLKASDIHIEPFEDRLRIRYRIDGALAERPSFSTQMHSPIIARLKVMGGMDISEKRIPQDGRITIMVDDVEYDIRVSMLPTVYGEKCVMRLALRANLQRDKKDLGLTDYDLKIFDKVFSNPNGIILVTGPTGSGKSTTLYTALSELSTEEVNVVTVEDPVEANVDGVNQVHTNAKAGLTFAAALRSILRQDPDIIMIGEIRDGETAEIAVQAAITGHLVVSTLHTNSSSASITRLINMGLEPYLVADSVVGILAQRLVRRLCPRCKQEKIATKEELKELGITKDVQLKIYEKGGCPYCNGTGYKGRIAVYEIMDVGPELKEMIMHNATTAEIKRAAINNGMHTLRRSAAELVVKGITTVSEMRKVSSES